MNKLDLITIREYKPEDKSFILATWLRGLFYGGSWFSEIPKNIFMVNYHRFIESILAKPNTIIYVACLKEDPEVILGYSILGSSKVAHWVFVKAAWRGIGIAKSLVPQTVDTATHLTKVGLAIAKNNKIVFDPFSI